MNFWCFNIWITELSYILSGLAWGQFTGQFTIEFSLLASLVNWSLLLCECVFLLLLVFYGLIVKLVYFRIVQIFFGFSCLCYLLVNSHWYQSSYYVLKSNKFDVTFVAKFWLWMQQNNVICIKSFDLQYNLLLPIF